MYRRDWVRSPVPTSAFRSIVIALVLAAAASGCQHGGGSSSVLPAGTSGAARQVAAVVAGVPLYISAGGPDAPGPPHYVADIDFSGGTVSGGTSTAINSSSVTNPAPQSVYQHGRYGNFSYILPNLTPSGAYTVRLHFCEYVYSATGKRVFNVSINGTQVLTNFDIFATTGARYKAFATAPFPATADATGKITIVFTNVVDHSIVQGIELQAATGPTPTPTPTPAPLAADYLTYHSDNLRSGWNQNETVLTVANVKNMTQKTQLSLDGDVLAQPLYVSQIPISGVMHNIVIVATEGDSVFAFDADTFALLWQKNLGPPQSSSEIGCFDIQPQYGITGTPVIVRTSNTSATIYVVAATMPSAGVIHTILHAMDAATGNDTASVTVAASATLSNGTSVNFVNHNQMNRAGLLFANGTLYVAFGSHCDHHMPTSWGWILRYSTSLGMMKAFITAEDVPPDGNFLASVWGGGFAPAADSSGNIFAATGNGAYDANTTGKNFGESVIKLPSDLSGVSSFFTPDDFQSLNNGDLDFGSGGVMLLPNNLAVAMGKASKLFLLHQSSLGGEAPGNPGAVQVYQDSGNGVWGGPAYFGGPGGPWVYYQTDNDRVRAFMLAGSSLAQSSASSTIGGYGGSSPIVTSNGMTDGTGLLWVVERSNPLVLEAYDARNLGQLLFRHTAGSWNNPNHNPFISPLVANGKAYVGGSSTLTVFGL
jgi:Malectin domain